ncbi:sigma-70 family RNA polymerase sigma factor [Sorangium sp. So ce375]|uniref:RNA polymerase sigma factor n=1 Tax=Sorangium sp. So ce375 TaxID=3133306 RepID=UPI003F5C9665
MRRLADGDRAAFEPVYAALWPALGAFCRRMLGGGADAEDAAQQALLKVFDRAGSFDPDGDALTWALAIAAWECRTTRRRHSRSREAPDELVPSIPADAPTPEDAAIARDLDDAAREVLGTLAEADRETLRATLEGDRDPSVSGAAFRKRRERAFARLREAWRRIYGT